MTARSSTTPGRSPAGPGIDLADLLVDPDEVLDAVKAELGSSAMFGARFREAASRALLLPRRRPDRRQPLWQQRQRSAQLLAVASEYPDFPILLEAVRECLQDDFDTEALTTLMRDVVARRVRVVEVTTTQPSPFAQSLLFGYTAQFLYDGDAPLAERRAAALTLDPTLLAELLGQGGESQLADLLDPEAVVRTEAELSGRAPERQAGTLEQLADAVRRHGPLTTSEAARAGPAEVATRSPAGWSSSRRARRLIRVRLGGVAPERAEQWAAIEDAGRLRDALGVALPVGVPEVFTEVVPDPVGDLLRRYARTHGPFTAAQAATRFGWGVAVVTETLRRLEGRGVLVQGRLRPDVLGGTGDEFCDAEVLRTLRRRSLAALRAEVEPVDPQALGVFLPRWQGVHPVGGPGTQSATGTLRGVDGVARVVEQLAGAVSPASALETHVLPARVVDYTPAMLDELTPQVRWSGRVTARWPGTTGWSPCTRRGRGPDAPPADAAPDTRCTRAVLEALGGWRRLVPRCADRTRPPAAPRRRLPEPGGPRDAVWDLVWTGHVTNDRLAPLRAWLGTGAPPTRPARRTARPSSASAARPARAPSSWPADPGRGRAPSGSTAPRAAVGGRCCPAASPTRRCARTRWPPSCSTGTGSSPGPSPRPRASAPGSRTCTACCPRSSRAVRCDAATSSSASAARSSRCPAPSTGCGSTPRWSSGPPTQDGPTDLQVVVLAATDPANPYGASLPWPVAGPDPSDAGAGRHRPGRKAGALVVLVDGALVLYLERGGRTVLTFTADAGVLAAAAEGLAATVRIRRSGRLTIVRVDGVEVLGGALRSTLGQALVAAGFATDATRPAPAGPAVTAAPVPEGDVLRAPPTGSSWRSPARPSRGRTCAGRRPRRSTWWAGPCWRPSPTASTC